LELPLVVFGNNVFDSAASTGANQVRYDGIRAEVEATHYLIKREHQSIAYVGDLRFPWFREQHRGYLKALWTQKFRMLLAPQSGAWQEAGVVRMAAELTAPAPILYQEKDRK
jgi:DNA-binding LacI/PurR family transcriptional regulator